MITPRFKLTQNDSSVTINIRAPYCNLSEVEISVEDEIFLFYGSPYYLRLALPGRILEDDFSKSSFDADSGEFVFTFRKVNEGEHFRDLDLITKLLTPKVHVNDPNDCDNESRKIVVLTNDVTKTEDLSEEFGFALSGKNNFYSVSAEFQDVFEVDPREIKLNERHKMRLQYEQGKFNMDHYLSDYIENEEILELIAIESPWQKLEKDKMEFTEKELDFLKDLPNTEYNLSDLQINYCHHSLIDILFAYCYDRRTTQFEGSCESGWTIVKLAASLCWLDVFENPKEALVSTFRRSVIYPLYRNFDLCYTVLNDLKQIFKLGDKFIIKCLIEIHNIFLKGDCCRYILNNLFINDYIVYVMKWDTTKWQEIVAQVEKTVIEKSDLGLNLKEIEDDVSSKLASFVKLSINEEGSDDTDDDDDDDSDSSSDDSDDTSSDSLK